MFRRRSSPPEPEAGPATTTVSSSSNSLGSRIGLRNRSSGERSSRGRGGLGRWPRRGRSRSVPARLSDARIHPPLKSILKICTLDESLHSTYGESAGGGSGSEEAKVPEEGSSGEEAKVPEDDVVLPPRRDGFRSGGEESQSSRRSIEFNEIHVREYARTVGDNPSCSSGPPVSISWECLETRVVSVEDYEGERPPRRNTFEMVLPRHIRQQMLRYEWDVTQSQIASAVRTNIKVKNQRRTTVNNLGKIRVEEMMENASRQILRLLFLRQSTSKQVRELERRMEEVERAREKVMVDRTF